MKKRILVPTDFSENGITLIRKIAQSDLENFELLFTHLFYLPDGIQDLLFSTYRVKEYEVISRHFTDSYRSLLSGKFTREELHCFPVKFFYGNTMIYFKNFLRANRIDEILWSEKYPCCKINNASMDAYWVIKKCGLKIINADEIKVKQPTTTQYAAKEQYSV